MRRYTVHLTEDQIARLHAESLRTGLKAAELLRRYVDAGLARIEEERKKEDTPERH